jgi:excisionase family DNA binding protein
MKTRPTQFGVRENAASSRQRAPRLAVETYPAPTRTEEENPEGGFNHPAHAASNYAATRGERKEENHLLTVREVAELLHVPVSWVYQQTRRRSLGRIPGFRLGKYWRFSAADVTAWIKAKRINHYPHD